ncbi:MAG: T9SS type A sorting domain-containing protein, partial [Nonlabens sp.]
QVGLDTVLDQRLVDFIFGFGNSNVFNSFDSNSDGLISVSEVAVFKEIYIRGSIFNSSNFSDTDRAFILNNLDVLKYVNFIIIQDIDNFSIPHSFTNLISITASNVDNFDVDFSSFEHLKIVDLLAVESTNSALDFHSNNKLTNLRIGDNMGNWLNSFNSSIIPQLATIILYDISGLGTFDFNSLIFLHNVGLYSINNMNIDVDNISNLRFLEVFNSSSFTSLNLQNLIIAHLELQSNQFLTDIDISGGELREFKLFNCDNINQLNINNVNINTNFDLESNNNRVGYYFTIDNYVNYGSFSPSSIINILTVSNSNFDIFAIHNREALINQLNLDNNSIRSINYRARGAVGLIEIYTERGNAFGNLVITNNNLLEAFLNNFSTLVFDDNTFGINSLKIGITGGAQSVNFNNNNTNLPANISGNTHFEILEADFRLTEINSLDLSNFITWNSWPDFRLDLNQDLWLDSANYLNLKGAQSNTINAITFLPHLFTQNRGVDITLPNLEHVCINDNLDAIAIDMLNDPQVGNGVVWNSYCNFVPGTIYNLITGRVVIDSNSNGCDFNDPIMPFLRMSATNQFETLSFISNSSGEYELHTFDGVYNLQLHPENPSYWNFSPSSVVVDFPTQTSPFTQDFCVTANGSIEDLEVIIVPLELARPGFDTDYKVVVKNKGNVTTSGSVTIDFEEEFMNLLSSTPTAATPATNQLSWSVSNLQPFQMEEYLFTMTLNTPTQTTNPLNGNDILTFTGVVIGTGTDAMPADNTMVFDQTIVNSYDPNDKTCLEGKTIDPSDVGEYVHYMIRFENTGTASAVNIVVKDEIDLSQFDITTLIPLGGSHDYYTRVREGNIVEFIHENINLDFNDATNDGYILFKIKTLNTLVAGDTFDNTAAIFFDFNAPIVTNTETVSIMSTASVGESTDSSISLYPNPAKNFITATANNAIEGISITDMNGRMITATQFTGAANEQRLEIGELSSG